MGEKVEPFFFFTKDEKYLIKTLKKYVLYMTDNHKTYLSMYFGLHSIKLYGESIYFIVNKNIFSGLDKKPDETYDIKGSWVDRHTNHHITDQRLMKDEDIQRPLLLNRLKAVGIYKQLQKDVA